MGNNMAPFRTKPTQQKIIMKLLNLCTSQICEIFTVLCSCVLISVLLLSNRERLSYENTSFQKQQKVKQIENQTFRSHPPIIQNLKRLQL